MEKSNSSSGDEDDYFRELPNFELNIFAGPPAKAPAKRSNIVVQHLLVQQC